MFAELIFFAKSALKALIFSKKSKYPSTVISFSDSSILYISKADILKLCTSNEEVLGNFMSALSNKIFILNSKIKSIAFKKKDVKPTESQSSAWKYPEAVQKLIDYLIKNGRTNTSEVVTSKTSGAKKAVLDYEVIHQISDERTESGKRILIKIHLETGRHHQIRCQLAKMGCPIKGDLKYGSERSNKDGGISLHARKAQFIHPVSKEPVEIVASVPDDSLWKGITASLI